MMIQMHTQLQGNLYNLKLLFLLPNSILDTQNNDEMLKFVYVFVGIGVLHEQLAIRN
jgi:hypothetical protein